MDHQHHEHEKMRTDSCPCGGSCSSCEAEGLQVNCGCKSEAKQFEYKESLKLGHEQHEYETGIIYTCPMHPEVRKTEPGKCPGCGMDLIPEKKSGGETRADHDMQKMSHMDHETAMTSPQMAKKMEVDMRKRFWVSLISSVPIFLLSPVGANFFGIKIFSQEVANWLLFILTTPIVFWTGSIFITGAYSYVRHPQYIGFIAVMVGFLLQWPTILTLIMFPILIFMYTRLAFREEKEMEDRFGDKYRKYRETVPAFFPRLTERKMISSD